MLSLALASTSSHFRQLFRRARRGGQLLVARRGLLRSRAEEVEAFLDMDRHALIFQAHLQTSRTFGDWTVTSFL